MDAAGRFQVRAAAPARKNVSCCVQSRECGCIRRLAAALEHHRLVGFHAEGGEGIEDVSRRAGNLAWRIEVFHADDPGAVLRARANPASDRGDQRAEMKRSGWRWRETAAIRHDSHNLKF